MSLSAPEDPSQDINVNLVPPEEQPVLLLAGLSFQPLSWSFQKAMLSLYWMVDGVSSDLPAAIFST